jgi:hypothetical protein
MEIVEIAKDRLKVVLDAEELREFAIDLAEMDGEGCGNNCMLDGILAVVRAKTEFGMGDGRIYVQIYPSRDGGCELFLVHIPLGKEKERMALVPFAKENGYLCCFESKEDAQSFCRLLEERGISEKEVFLDTEGGRYLFYVAESRASALFLEEFGKVADGMMKNYLREHFKQLSDF